MPVPPGQKTPLSEFLPEAGQPDFDGLGQFLTWAEDQGLTLYPAQEEAVMELMTGQHVVLATPTGSGKSMVALALHFKAMAEGKRSAYTSPIKALVNEKFFDLCRQLGPDNVGMMTGDASINPQAPVLCCTAEILSNLALREGDATPIEAVVMDEFHYYSDADRGIAWQLPLITMRRAQFLLMSATLGEVTEFERGLSEFTGTTVAVVRSEDRPVPLTFEYRETPVHESIHDLAMSGQAPVYVVNFTQREAAEMAQDLTSVNVSTKEEKRAISTALRGFRFDTPYGKDIKRYLSHGIGLHHAGLLPKYRMLVERLAQQGMLKIICGTDTLGVGVNVPIRSVLFTKLCKFDGEKVGILAVRDFKQIAGRAGRKGYDDQGWVVAQAPAHVIENKKLEVKAAASAGGKKKKFHRKKPPERGYVHWDEKTFHKLIESQPEPLTSRFSITHGMLLTVLDREIVKGRPDGGYRKLMEVIDRSYERPALRKRHRQHAARLFRSLVQAGIVEIVRPGGNGRPHARVSPELQLDFSLNHTLSTWLYAALEQLDRESDVFALEVISLMEAILEKPRVVLMRQVDLAKGELVQRLKAEGVEYEQRMEQLERVEYPKPCAEFIYRTFDTFRATRPWVREHNVSPKSIAREMFEDCVGFDDYINKYGLARSEGVLFRYLMQAFKTLVQNVPEDYRDEALTDAIAYMRTTLAHVDNSLLTDWERMRDGGPVEIVAADDEPPPEPEPYDLANDPRGLGARVRAELHPLVRALTRGDFDAALRTIAEEPEDEWSVERLEAEWSSVLAEEGRILFDREARAAKHTRLTPDGPRRWRVEHTLIGPQGPSPWRIVGEVDLTEPDAASGLLVRLRAVTD
ncbi:MAG: DUF3516 domain-containing protein [Deltaproteobacteria bacterium]|nr:DUF3516 domain-containing protein [Deltaproteobacteria bacterium]